MHNLVTCPAELLGGNLSRGGQSTDCHHVRVEHPTLFALPCRWGCEVPLPGQRHSHVVISTQVPDPRQLLPWIWQLGLTGAHIFVYGRHNNSLGEEGGKALLAAVAAAPLPCDMKLQVKQLTPNLGRESAVFLTHILRHWVGHGLTCLPPGGTPW